MELERVRFLIRAVASLRAHASQLPSRTGILGCLSNQAGIRRYARTSAMFTVGAG